MVPPPLFVSMLKGMDQDNQKQKEDAENLQHILPPALQRSMELSQEKGDSTWLTTLPIDEHGLLYTELLSETTFRSDMVG